MELDTVKSWLSIPAAAIASLAICAWISELDSAEQYRIPIFFASGRTFCSRSICSATGVRSEVPVTFPPGTSLVSTRPDSAGSVTAVISTGVSVTAPAIAWAAGVAMARIRSLPSLANLEATVWHTDWSPEAFCWSRSYWTPASSNAFIKPWLAASRAGCWVSCKIPIL